MMNITIKIEATELSDAMNNLAIAIGDIVQARAEHNAAATAKATVAKAKKSAQPEVAKNTGSSGSDQPQEPGVSAADAGSTPPLAPTETPAAPPAAAQSEAAAPITVEQVRAAILAKGKEKLAAAKNLVSGYGVTGVSQIPSDKLPELMAKVEAL